MIRISTTHNGQSPSVIRKCSSIGELQLGLLEKQLGYRRSLAPSDISSFMGFAVVKTVEVELVSAEEIRGISNLASEEPCVRALHGIIRKPKLNTTRGFNTMPVRPEPTDIPKRLSLATDEEIIKGKRRASTGFRDERYMILDAWARECGLFLSECTAVLESDPLLDRAVFAQSNGPKDDEIMGQLCDNPALVRYVLGDVTEFSPPEIRAEPVLL